MWIVLNKSFLSIVKNRKNVADKISDELLKINYDNFKNSVSKNEYNRANAYMNVWSALNKLQQ